jgi:hypothetical protein
MGFRLQNLRTLTKYAVSIKSKSIIDPKSMRINIDDLLDKLHLLLRRLLPL